jgi:gamma-butyrobetaine dioxygenase
MNLMTSPVTVKDEGLEVPLPSGETAYFNHYWLRDNCSTSFDPETRERVFDIFHLAQPPRPASACVADDALEIVWSGENQTSRYPLAWLENYSRGQRRADPSDLKRVSWYGDHYPKVARFAHADLMADRELVAQWLRAMLVEGVSLVTAMPDSDQALTNLVQLMGQVRPTFFGDYFDVHTHIAPTNLAYTAKALELHTDVPAEDLAPGVQFLHCRANSVEGGENLFLDGIAVANDLRETAVPFYFEHDNQDVRARQRVIELDENGDVSGVTISQHMADVFDLPQHFMDRYYPAFCRFGRMLQADKYLMRFRIAAGECIVFDNHRIVHGRSAYSATSGDRYLRGTYADRGEMRSTYRALTGKGRFA